MKDFDKWNNIKKKVEGHTYPFFHEREIFYARLGINIGFEQCGKGEDFERPVLILKKFNNSVFWGIPLSTTSKTGKYYYHFEFFPKKRSVAIIPQMKLIDAKRLDRKIGKMSTDDFLSIKWLIAKYLNLAPKNSGGQE